VPAPGDALVKVRLAGICRTDLEITRGYMQFTGVLGHEYVGMVAECRHREWVGRRVTGEINFSCGECPFCRSNMPSHCPARTVLGISGHDGCFAEYAAVPVTSLHLVPDEIADEEAVFVEPLAACFQVPEQVHLPPSGHIIVLGAGKLGLLMAQVVRLLCAEVTVAAKHPHQLALAGKLGLKAIAVDQIRERSKIIIDCTGSPEGFQLAQKLVVPRGTIILKSTFHQTAQVDIAPFVVNEISVIGSRCGPFQPAINALKNKLVQVRPLIAATCPLARGMEALQAANQSAALKILLDMRTK
jgi:threonine dehydrogenase-like Zn-dependent dehydrogenase